MRMSGSMSVASWMKRSQLASMPRSSASPCGAGAERALGQRIESLAQGGAVVQRLLGGRIGGLLVLGEAEQGVAGGDDVLDLAAGLGFQQRDGVDEDGLVGDGGADALEFGQGGAGLDAGLEQRPGSMSTAGGNAGRSS